MTFKSPGYFSFTLNETLNFMLNRLTWEGVPQDKLYEIGTKVTDLDNFIEEMLLQAGEVEKQGKLLQAGVFYRAAEFFMSPDHPEKKDAFDKFITYFYQETPGAKECRKLVPYSSGKLGVIDIPAQGVEKDVLLFCSGFDGLIEELYNIGLEFSKSGYRVVLYEGPGQGQALRYSGMTMSADWEKPTKAVLDYLQIDSCTIVGISLGGLLAPRAAAYEDRIKRVVSWGAMYDFADCVRSNMGERKGAFVFWLVRQRLSFIINLQVRALMFKDPKSRWGAQHGMHVSGTKSPYGFLKWLQDFNLRSVSHMITQDSLIISGEDDHLAPIGQLYELSQAQTKAKSVTARVATAREHGAEHCQIGNPMLVIDSVLLWLEGLDRRDKLIKV